MAQVEWVLRGRVLLVPQLPEIATLATVSTDHGMAVPLAGVPVKVSAKEFDADPTGWNEWNEGVTDDDGRFEIRHIKDRSKRLFRFRAQFKDANLKIYPPNDGLAKSLLEAATMLVGGPITQLGALVTEQVLMQLVDQLSRAVYDVKWQTMHEDASGHKHDVDDTDFAPMVFRGGGSNDLGDFTARRHAEIWWLLKKAGAYLADLGFPFRGDRPIATVHPFDNPAIGDGIESSYSNPYMDTTFLVRNSLKDHFDAGTILHEMMHLWAYQHTEDEDRLATYLLVNGTTHNGRIKSWAAWHEAFAEVISNQLYRDLFGAAGTVYGGFTAQHRPYSRPYLKKGGLMNTADLEVFEDGWQSVLGLLLCPDVCDLDMNAAGPYAADASPGAKGGRPTCWSPTIKLADVLAAVGDDAKDGGLPRDAMRVAPFLERIDVPGFNDAIRSAYIAILDPAGTAQPRSLLPSSMTSTLNTNPMGASVGPNVHIP